MVITTEHASTRTAAGHRTLAQAIRNWRTSRRRGAMDPGHAQLTAATPASPSWRVLRVIENDSACDYAPLSAVSSLADIRPEDVIGDGISERDWTRRSEHEMPVHHLHVRVAYLPRVVCTEVHADSYGEAACEAIGDVMAHRNDELSAAGLAFPRDFESEDSQQLPYCLHEAGDACREGCHSIVVTLMG